MLRIKNLNPKRLKTTIITHTPDFKSNLYPDHVCVRDSSGILLPDVKIHETVKVLAKDTADSPAP